MTRYGTITVTCAAILSTAVGLGAVAAQSAGRQQSASQPVSEHQFVPQAAMANMAEVQLGHLALKKAQNADVKKFAQMMVDDHLGAQNELADVAAGANIQWPKQLDEKHRKLQQRLSGISGAQFDREYMKAMVDGHREVEMMFTTYIGPARGTKADSSSLAGKVQPWAAKVLSDVKVHLKEAEQISATLEKGA